MRTSSIGRALIEQREGRRLSAYRDTRGILTIGVGHTGRMAAPPVTPRMTITEAQCDAILAGDLAPVEAAIAAAVTVPVSQNEFDAMASLAFNIGTAGFRSSSVVRKLNAGDVAGAADAFMNWCKPAALTRRRDDERKQFRTPNSDVHSVTSARSAHLAHKAEVIKSKAMTTAAGGGAAVVIGTASTVAATAAHHGHLAWIVGGLFALGAAIDGIVTVLNRRSAQVLSTNATMQAIAADQPLAAPAAAPMTALTSPPEE